MKSSYGLHKQVFKYTFAIPLVLFLILSIAGLPACANSGSGPGEIVTKEISRLEKLVKENPAIPDMRVDLAILYSKAGLHQKAITQLKAALDLKESHQGALIALGDVYIQLNRYQDAIGLYNRVVELNRDNPMANTSSKLEGVYYHLGFAYFYLDRMDEAILSLVKAVSIDSTDADAMYLLGASYQHQGKFEKAIENYMQAIRFVPDFVEAYQGLAQSYEKTGQANLALYADAMVAYNSGSISEAISQLEIVIAAMPDFAGAYLGLGLACEKQGLIDEAISAYKNALILDPDIWLAQARLKMLGAS